MDAELQNTIVLLASLMVGVLIAQTVLMLVFVIAFRNWCQRTGSLLDQLSGGLEPILRSSREILKDSSEKFAAISSNLQEITRSARDQMERLNTLVRDTTDRARVQVVRLDHLVEDTLNRVEETTQAIQRGILEPAREISALIAGVRAGLQFFLHRNRKTVERATQDEEMFI
ncbi:MAG TPA: hypothetical protein VNN17_00895 [Terriglobia bacterium]|nr:hypothetical protein [Terriglobia bacterium]